MIRFSKPRDSSLWKFHGCDQVYQLHKLRILNGIKTFRNIFKFFVLGYRLELDISEYLVKRF